MMFTRGNSNRKRSKELNRMGHFETEDRINIFDWILMVLLGGSSDL
jgi:hypothetical protein